MIPAQPIAAEDRKAWRKPESYNGTISGKGVQREPAKEH
jgi:hypothetical protein